MNVDENVFFREATLRICSSLNIVEALKSCFGYIKPYVPTNRIFFHIYNADLNLTRIVASVGDDMMEEPERILYYPEKGRNKRAAMLNEDLLKNEVVIRIWNQPDQMEGLPEILERLGLNAKTSLMNMLLKLVEGNQIASLALFANGLNQYTAEHARLLKLLHEPFAISISNALRHQEIIRFKDELMSHLRFFQNMDRINRAMQGTNDLEDMMIDVLDAMLSIFDSDRAFLLYPCDPDAPSFEIAMERTRPEYPARRSAISTAPDNAKHFQLYLGSSGAVTLGPGCDYPLETSRFGEKSKIMMALHPKTGKPWVLGMHQCSYPRVWSRDEKNLLEEIARRMNDVLTGLLAYRDLHESEERQRVTLQTAMDGFLRADTQGRILEVNETYCRMSGYSEQELLTMNIEDIEAVHSAEMIAANIRRFAELGPSRFESVHRRKDGSLFDLEISAQHQPIAGGQSVVFVRDITERKRAERALRRSEAYLAEAQRLTHMGTWADDGTMQPVYWSEEVFRMFGLDPQQGVPTRDQPLQRVHPEDLDGFMQAFHRAIHEKVDSDFEFRTVLPDGTVKYCHALAHPVLNANGELVEILGTTADITERKKAEEALRQSEAYLAEAQRLSHTGSWAFDFASDKYVYVSEECLRIFELDAQEGIPNREAVSRRIHPEDWDRVNGDFEKLLREKVDTSSEFRIALPDGTVKHIQVIRHPVQNSAGDIVRIVGTAIDMTERKRVEEERHQSAERFRAIADYTYDWENWIGVDGKLLWVNPAVERITGYSVGECMAMPDFPIPIVAEADRETVARQIREAVQGSSRNDFEFRVRHKDGHLAWVAASWQPIYDSRGARLGHRSSIRDIAERKQAQEKMRQQEMELRRVLDVTPQLVAVYGPDRERLYANRPTLDYFGVTLKEWQSISDPFWVFHPDDRERVAKDVYTGAASDVPHEFEGRLRRKDGTYRWFLFRDNPLRDEQGRITRWYLSAADIEDRKRAEEALQRNEVYLAEAQRLSHTGSWAFDLASGKFAYASEECIRMYEHDAQEGLPTREATFRLIHPEDRDSVQGGFEKSLREKVDTSSEFRLVLPSGTVKHVQTIRHPVLNEAGDVVELVGTTIDITERKRAEEAVRLAGVYLSNIIDSMPSILVGMDNTRTVTQWNRQAEAFTGIPAGEAIGKPIVHLLPDFAPWIMTMGSDMDEHRPSSMEKLLIAKEGERRFYDLMLYPLLVDTVGGAVLRIEDVTERARTQELMVQTGKMMSIGGLAAGMAHEINNPLGIITQAAQNIDRRISLELHANRKVSEELGLNLEGIRAYFDKRQITDAIASIRMASSRAAKIVANMLQFSRRADTTTDPASLAQIVDQALELAASDYDLKKHYDFRSIDITKDYQDVPQVRIASVEIEQVILNLLKNAAQAMTATPPDTKPRITLRLRCEDRYAVLEVEDNGPGMTEDIRRRVFEPFFTTKEPGEGTGLGLSVSYMIVTQNHKGLMDVQSTPGRGTVFKVRLPIGESKT